MGEAEEMKAIEIWVEIFRSHIQLEMDMSKVNFNLPVTHLHGDCETKLSVGVPDSYLFEQLCLTGRR